MTEFTIERLGHHGDGIAEGPVYVPRTLPGEIVEGVAVGGKVATPRISKPSQMRVAAPCRHYKSCGGCGLQHATDEFVSAWKADVVRNALAAHGLDAPIRHIHTSSLASRRRAVFSGRRTKKGAMVGFHAPASDALTAVPNCLILTPALVDAAPALEALTRLGASRKSELRLAVTESETGLDVAVTDGKALDIPLTQDIAAVAEEHDLARVSWDGETVVQRRPPTITLGAAPVPLSPGAFLQATHEGEVALMACVAEAVGKAKSVIDLFAGCGTFSLPLAQHASVLAVENDASLLTALDQGWRHAAGLKRVETLDRDLFRRPMLRDELAKFDAAVIDPPRAGAEAQTIELAQSGIKKVASVSCNPVTFGRDAQILTKAGYQLKWLDVVDQFRWSTHVEVAGAFELA